MAYTEKRYLVKCTEIATENNPRHPNETIRIYGKGSEIVYAHGTWNGFYDCDKLQYGIVARYGFKRECDAKKSYQYKNEGRSDSMVNRTVEIICYELDEYGNMKRV